MSVARIFYGGLIMFMIQGTMIGMGPQTELESFQTDLLTAKQNRGEDLGISRNSAGSLIRIRDTGFWNSDEYLIQSSDDRGSMFENVIADVQDILDGKDRSIQHKIGAWAVSPDQTKLVALKERYVGGKLAEQSGCWVVDLQGDEHGKATSQLINFPEALEKKVKHIADMKELLPLMNNGYSHHFDQEDKQRKVYNWYDHVAISNDGKKIALADTFALWVYNLKTGKAQKVHQSPIRTFRCFNPLRNHHTWHPKYSLIEFGPNDTVGVRYTSHADTDKITEIFSLQAKEE